MQVPRPIPAETPEQMYVRVFRQLKPRSRPPSFRVEYRPFANANSFIKMEGTAVTVRISDLLAGAPAPVLEALASILLAKLFRKPVPAKHNDRYRRYLNRRDVRRRLHLVRQTRGWKVMSGPSGEVYDLEELFEELNLRFFHGLMARPELGWSRRRSRTTLGHYDPSHNVIVISRILDRSEAPRLVLEYVMFHEMLHLKFPAQHNGTRRRVHTKEFHEAEKQFPGFDRVKDLLKQL